ncbi:MAG TPA: thiamine phosphate synthase, partial [Dehalococcoidia bacterium]|nr:thiamine phosphate synthase [Dehalococcoidia bacterium]
TLELLYLKLAAALRREQAHRVRGLYVIIDPEVTDGRDPLDIARGAGQGGAKMLQLRDKLRDKGASLPLALSLQQLCQERDVLLIINDHVDLAAAVGSGGLHVGQTDLPVAQARQVLAPHQVLGRSNREFEQLVESQEMGADHVAFGPIYQSGTKSTGREPQGPQRLRQARDLAKVPLVAIGGINAENVAPVVEAGADAICVTAAVGAAPDPEAAASRLVEAIRDAGGKV